MIWGLPSIHGVPESWLLSQRESRLETEIWPKEAVYSGLPSSLHSQVEGEAEPMLSLTWPCAVLIYSAPHPPALLAWFWPPVPRGDLEGSTGRVPHSHPSWDTQCESPWCPVYIHRPNSELACSDVPSLQHKPNEWKLFVLLCGFIYYKKIV